MDHSKALGVLYLTCGSTAAIAIAPSTPIWLPYRSSVFSRALKNPMREKMSEATDALVSRLLGIGWRCGLDHSKALGALYLTWGSAAARNFAPSTPILFPPMLRLVNGALKNPTREKMR